MRGRLLRSFSALSLAGALFPFVSCARNVGGLMVEVRSDGLELDRLEVLVETTAGTTLAHRDYDVDASSFPATVGITNDRDNTQLWVQVAGFDDDEVKDARRLLVKYLRRDETRLLRVTLSSKCTKWIEPKGPHDFSQLCAVGETCDPSSGVCESATIDFDSLPEWDPSGAGGGGSGGGSGNPSGGMGGDPLSSDGGTSTSGGALTGGGPSSGGAPSCVESAPQCAPDRGSVVTCEEGIWTVVEQCADGLVCADASLECQDAQPECEAASSGQLFCGADQKRYRCGPGGLASETEEAPCPQGVPCLVRDRVATCVAACAEDNGGCDPRVSCTETFDGPKCGACPADSFSTDQGKTCVLFRECEPGQKVSAEGNGTQDRVCEPCESGSYSSTPNSLSCTPHSCPDGTLIAAQGTPTQNHTCFPFGPGQWGTGSGEQVGGFARDLDGNFVLVGSTEGALFGANAGGSDVFVAKFDANMAFLWGQQLGSAGEDFAYAVALGPTGEIFVGGQTDGALTGTAAQRSDGFVLRLASSGALDWAKSVATSSDDLVTALALTSSGRLVAGGGTKGALAGLGPGANAGGQDAFVRVFDPATGSTAYTDQWGTNGDDGVAALAPGKTDAIYAVANVRGNLAGETGYSGIQSVGVRAYTYGTWGMSTNYQASWTEQFGDGTETLAYGAVFSGTTDRIHIVGSVNAALYDPATDEDLTHVGGRDAFLRTFRTTGDNGFARQFGTSADDMAMAITVDESGGLLLCGSTAGALGAPTAGGTDVFFKDYSSTGVSGATSQMGSPGGDVCRALVSAGGRVWSAGDTDGRFEGQTNFGDSDVFLLERPSGG